ncbi:uncharacterized protein LOC129595563 isoform X1 [Paramacrobiotus metropolitanus]|uniref:uncharacterized protein LOC129595563 isoform X1 n=1 Tax=Paramacrobiotus metropolitanus TaxID=2943436 RepID=UPI0024458485|nr:uncharacterized protein LOC129595563 isoform X1 [Paramacrobiotus metropolitanus]
MGSRKSRKRSPSSSSSSSESSGTSNPHPPPRPPLKKAEDIRAVKVQAARKPEQQKTSAAKPAASKPSVIKPAQPSLASVIVPKTVEKPYKIPKLPFKESEKRSASVVPVEKSDKKKKTEEFAASSSSSSSSTRKATARPTCPVCPVTSCPSTTCPVCTTRAPACPASSTSTTTASMTTSSTTTTTTTTTTAQDTRCAAEGVLQSRTLATVGSCGGCYFPTYSAPVTLQLDTTAAPGSAAVFCLYLISGPPDSTLTLSSVSNTLFSSFSTVFVNGIQYSAAKVNGFPPFPNTLTLQSSSVGILFASLAGAGGSLILSASATPAAG